MFRYGERFVCDLVDDIGKLITGDHPDSASIEARLYELAVTNSSTVANYWRSAGSGHGVPDSAYKHSPPYFFPDREPARTFHTSGTTSGRPGRAHYSPLGLDLLRTTIIENARRNILTGLDRPAFIRFVPAEDDAPHMVMAHGMQLIATTFGDPAHSAVVVGRSGIDYPGLRAALERVVAAGQPAALIGGSSAFVNCCTELADRGVRFELPEGSRVVDAGGFKGRSRSWTVPELRAAMIRTFGIADHGFINLFGMTELASQLYDAADEPVGPLGERPKGRTSFVWPLVRDPRTMTELATGQGLLEVVDLCQIDRPAAVLTGDLAIGTASGVAIVGRAERGAGRGCSLSLDTITAPEVSHV